MAAYPAMDSSRRMFWGSVRVGGHHICPLLAIRAKPRYAFRFQNSISMPSHLETQTRISDYYAKQGFKIAVKGDVTNALLPPSLPHFKRSAPAPVFPSALSRSF
jgi:hypothetical protein